MKLYGPKRSISKLLRDKRAIYDFFLFHPHKQMTRGQLHKAIRFLDDDLDTMVKEGTIYAVNGYYFLSPAKKAEAEAEAESEINRTTP
jgi:hypothetical protein